MCCYGFGRNGSRERYDIEFDHSSKMTNGSIKFLMYTYASIDKDFVRIHFDI